MSHGFLPVDCSQIDKRTQIHQVSAFYCKAIQGLSAGALRFAQLKAKPQLSKINAGDPIHPAINGNLIRIPFVYPHIIVGGVHGATRGVFKFAVFYKTFCGHAGRGMSQVMSNEVNNLSITLELTAAAMRQMLFRNAERR